MIAFLPSFAVLLAVIGSASAQIGLTSASLASFTSGLDGVRFGSTGNTGYSVGQVGDYSGDGIADFVVSANTASFSPALGGMAVLVLGSPRLDWTDIDMSTVTSSNNTRRMYSSDASVAFGSSVGGAGDVNMDGFYDLLVSAPFATGGISSQGAVYVMFGLAPPYTDLVFNTSFTASLVGGFAVYNLLSGSGSLADWNSNTRTVGDINADDIDDFVVSCFSCEYSTRANAGVAAIIYGSRFPPVVDLELSNLGSRGALLGGAAAGARLGYSVDGVEDFDGSGARDLVVGSRDFSPVVGGVTRAGAGAAYLLFGGVGIPSQDLLNFVTGLSGVLFLGAVAGDETGHSVGGAGSINGDIFPDLLIGAPKSTVGSLTAAGRVYVIYGTPVLITADVDLATFTSGADGYIVLGSVVNQQVGSTVAQAGDINMDGVEDFMIGAVGTNQVFVVFGSTTIRTTDLDLGTATISEMYVISTPTSLGFSIYGGYDVTGDGYPDLMLSAANDNSAFMVKGPLPRSNTFLPTFVPTARPTVAPSALPTSQPSSTPSGQPTSTPSGQPSALPSTSPTTQPSSRPSAQPNGAPTSRPSVHPAAVPTSQPSAFDPWHRPSDGSPTNELTGAEIAGLVIGIIFFILLVTTCALFVIATRRRSDEDRAAAPSPPADGYEMTGV